MCLILFSWNPGGEYPLVLAANRDEFHDRPAAVAQWWSDHPEILAGRDLQAGGTWLGVNRSGRFAALTNYREPGSLGNSGGASRGALVKDFLLTTDAPMAHAETVARYGHNYSGFNLLLGDQENLLWVSNRADDAVRVEPGVHGLSNHLLDTDWPKVHVGKDRLKAQIDVGKPNVNELFSLLTDPSPTVGKLPENVEPGLSAEDLARHYFIRSPVYGTRCSTVLVMDSAGVSHFEERSFDAKARQTNRVTFSVFEANASTHSESWQA